MVRNDEHGTVTHMPAHRRRTVRHVAAALCAIVGVLYLILLFLVAKAESVPGAADGNTYGAYLFLAGPYLVGGGLLAAVDRRAVWVAGAAVQVLVIALFVMFGVGVFGPGVFEYAALAGLRMELWASAITGLQVILLGLLCYLSLRTPSGRRTARPRRIQTRPRVR